MILDIFREICARPHESFKTDELRIWLENELKKCDFMVKSDEFGNIYAIKGEPKICLQAHYDMVKVGSNERIEILTTKNEKGEFWSAKDSSLGADNGVGVAIALYYARTQNALEILLTNNEEVGLLGATNFAGYLISPRLLNLDTEDEHEIINGCAGDVKVKFEKEPTLTKVSGKFKALSLKGLRGGHSGIEIAKNIPNAISELAKFVKARKGRLAFFKGGERINSIPANAECLAFFEKPFVNFSDFVGDFALAEKLEVSEVVGEFGVENGEILRFLSGFKSGVYESENGETVGENADVRTSVNLSLVEFSHGKFCAEVFARSCDNAALKRVCNEFCKNEKFYVHVGEFSPAWKPVKSEFCDIVAEAFKKNRIFAKVKHIHAGLECGVLSANQKRLFGRDVSAVSVGPNITSPHSTSERLDVESARRICAVVKTILDSVNSLA